MAWALKWVEQAVVTDPRVWLVSRWSTIHGADRASWSADPTEALTLDTESDALALRDCGAKLDWHRCVVAVEVPVVDLAERGQQR